MNIEDYSCRLYIQSKAGLSELIEKMGASIGATVSRGTVRDDYFFCEMRKNDDAKHDRLGERDGFLFSAFTGWVEPIDEIEERTELADREIYLDLLMHMIIELRKNGAQVVASCEYEDLITERTGWNWGAETTNHP